MNNNELTSDESIELEKRGFFVKGNFGFFDLLKSFLCIIVYISFAIIPLSLSVFFIVFLPDVIGYGLFGIAIIISLLPILIFLRYYLVSGKTFYLGNNNVLELGNISKNGGFLFNYKLFLIDGIIDRMIHSGSGGIGAIVYALIFPIGLFYGFPIIEYFNINHKIYLSEILFSTIFIIFKQTLIIAFGILVFTAVLFLIRTIFQQFHSLSNFGNLGEKIQKLTPEIEKQSHEIRSNFEKDMNFSVLSSGFDSLSITFSKIISLVIRLEKVEKKANKGNLFDSEKYINSLRSDITEPLKSLRVFLEEQRKKLMQGQKELEKVRVRVGADPSILSGGQEESELSSKRSEKLIIELGENIEKLDGMIGKMG